MSYMIEKHTRDERLLARADALVERRMGRPRAGKATPTRSPVRRARGSTRPVA
jgi:hypothetical protein